MLFGFSASKCKTQCRLGVGRVRLLRNKKQLAMKSLRKEVAELMRQGKQGNARIRVEAVMREHRMLQAFEILELYLELLAVRAELLGKTKEIPGDMVEAVCSLIYAGERVATDLAEVAQVGKMLTSKYNSPYKDAGFPHEVVSDLTCRKWQVNDDLVTCLAVSAPLPLEKLAFLEDIATEFDVEFDRDATALDMSTGSRPTVIAGPVVYATPEPVHTLAAGGAVTGPPSLAQTWRPPAEAPPPHPAAAAQAGWQGPGAGPPTAPQRVLSGGSVVSRPGGGAPPGLTAQPSAADVQAGSQGWAPPKPDDLDRAGKSFQRHVGATAAWRQTRLSGTSGSSSPDRAASGSGPWAGLGGLPAGTAQSSGTSTPSVGDKPPTPGSSYTDASQAAEAARRYSHMAAEAAQRAEQFAAGQAGRGGSGHPGDDDGQPGSSGGGGGGDGRYVSRTFSEVKRAYDAAPGPPTKAEKTAGEAGPPSAPPAPAAPAATQQATSGDAGADLDLPSVPSVGQAAPPPVQDELDKLTKRFEALKKR
ncbi:IST1-like protein [Micractinium conductrix]|uniref:IST1-like protein n=1 Tax=Micractinium conductrix TaxID=554055 RepID=A0A2P6VAU1_9CHLO|nr:IST1-like protein [Micractinium conductrix]|eukprot:PSC71204.1 IST1-like protein [Micractinium conductrix]